MDDELMTKNGEVQVIDPTLNACTHTRVQSYEDMSINQRGADYLFGEAMAQAACTNYRCIGWCCYGRC